MESCYPPPPAFASTEAELVAQVESALYQLYNDPDPANKSMADRWLQALQQSSHAWRLSWTLLHHQTFEVKNFGALMLQSKINRAWNELPSDQHDILRVELFKHMASYSSGPPLVLTQLCRAVVGVAFQTMPEKWPNTVVSCIHSLRKACGDVQGSDFPSGVIQLLTIFPEEYDRVYMTAVAAKRGTIKAELAAGLSSVISLMEEIITVSHDFGLKSKAINCCRNWVCLGVPITEMASLLNLIFSCAMTPQLLECASDMLCDVVAHEDSFKYPQALRRFLKRVLDLRVFARRSLDNSEVETCMSLAKLIQATAVCNMTFLTSLSENSSEEDCEDALTIVQMVMEYLCVPGTYPVDERYSEVTFAFWGNFLDELSGLDPTQTKFLLQLYSSHMSSLMDVFPDKAQYPPEVDWMESWVDDERDDFVKYREDLCDLGECLQLTMHVEYLQRLSTLFTDLLSSQAPSWQSLEAVLYLLQGIAPGITQHSSALLQGILSYLPTLPPHPILIKTALSLLGLLSTWFKQQPALLRGLLPIILSALARPDLATCAALAFRDVCLECSAQLATVADQLIPHCQEGLSNPYLTSRDCVCLVVAIGGVLSSLPVEDLMRPLSVLVTSRVSRLQLLAQQEPTEASRGMVERELDVLGALCHHIYPDLQEGQGHPVMLLLMQVFPTVQVLISKWCRDDLIVESICVVINRAMRTVEKQYGPLLGPTIELIIRCYAAVHHHKLLDSAAQVVEVFGKDASFVSLVSALLQPLHTLSLQLFQSSLNEHPDLVQGFLALNATTLKTNPSLVLNCDGIMNSFYEFGFAALKLPEQPTVSAASSFLVTFISVSPRVAQVAEVLRAQGNQLVQYVLQAIAGEAPRSYLGSFSDILYDLQCYCVTPLSQWLTALLGRDGFPSDCLTNDEKDQFKAAILRPGETRELVNCLRGQQNKRILKEKVREFSLKCRGFHGTMYAAVDTI